MKTDKIQKLADALRRADKAAREINCPDDGSANLDSPTIRLKEWRDSDVQKAADEAGIRIDDKMTSSWWRGYRFVRTHCDGQGHRRMEQAIAVTRSLQADGYESCVFYWAD